MLTGKVAVIAVSCRYPGAASPRELWENILSKRSQFRDFPRKRLPAALYSSSNPRSEDRAALPQAAFIDGWTFDPVAWRVPRRTFEATDPTHWLALELAVEAVEMAGGPHMLPKERTAVYVGNTLTGEFTRSRSLRQRWPYVARTLSQVLREQGMPEAERKDLLARFRTAFRAPFAPTSEDTLAGSLSNTIAGRICGYFDVHGGGYTVDGACASSLLAVVTACERLVTGEVDVALAGGVDISLDPFEVIGFAKAGALAKQELRIYDARANGMMPGEGAGFVLLKRLEDARRDGDFILAELDGWGVSSDGSGAITAPVARGQSRALVRAWTRAGISAADLDFVEGHGTGTTAGDPVELEGIALAMTETGTAPARRCGVTSLKSIVGHTKAAAGVGALVKAILAVNQRVLPPTSNCEEPHPAFDGSATSLYPIRAGRLMSPDSTLRGAVSAMGFGGINAHVTLKSADPPHPRVAPSVPATTLLSSAQRAEVIVAAGDSASALLEALRNLQRRARGMATGELIDLSCESWKTARGLHRAAIVASSPKHFLELIEQLIEAITNRSPLPAGTFVGHHETPAPVGVVFPGQGSQRAGAARARFARSGATLRDRTLAVISSDDAVMMQRALTPDDAALDLRALTRELKPTRLAQPAITAVSLAWWRWLFSAGFRPTRVAGHSLGELTALHAVGAIDVDSTLKIAALRGRAMSGSSDDGMVLLPLNADESEQILREAELGSDPKNAATYAVVANRNSPIQTIISGTVQALDRLKTYASRRGIEARDVPVSRAFHSALLDDAAQALSDASDIPPVVQLSGELISSVDGKPRSGRLELRSYLANQVVQPVLFTHVVEAFSDVDLVIELGPGAVLSGLFRDCRGPLCLPIESRPGADEDTCAVLGALFTRGHRLIPEVIFEGRWVKPFVPASNREFLINPCEALVDENPNKRDLRLNETAPHISIALAGDPLTVIFRRTEEITGFPAGTLRPEHRLLDDLNLDSIKITELVATVSKDLDVSSAAVQEHAKGTLAELAQACASAPPADEANTEDPTWVAAFEERPAPAPARSTSPHPWRDQAVRVWTLDGSLRSLLERCIEAEGAKVADDAAHHLVLLPSDGKAGELLPLLIELARTLPGQGSLLVLDPRAGRVDDAAAWCASVHLERPQLKVRYVELDLPLSRLSHAIDELRDDAAHRHVSWCSNDPTIRLAHYVSPEPEAHRPGVTLVTGGAKGITASCALALAKRAGGRYALVGRSPADSEVQATLAAFGELGIDAKYFRADLAKAAEVRRLVDEVREGLGPVSWLVHGAGLNVPRPVAEPDGDAVEQEIAPKLYGMDLLLEALEAAPPERIVALTSIIGVTGMPGNAWYAYANASLHHLLQGWQQQHPAATVLSLAYSVWDDVGMGVRLGSVNHLARHGVAALPAKSAADAFAAWATAGGPPCRQVIVTGRVGRDFLDTWQQPTPRFQGRFIDDVRRETPEVELVTDFTLHPASDPYLLDHEYEGSLLFPTVFGLEAMAQGIRRLIGGVARLEVRDLSLERPIVAHPERGQVVRLSVVRTDASTFSCSLSCASSRFEVPHFSGLWTVNADAPSLPLEQPREELAIEPDTELYGSVLFQGPLFHQIRKVHKLAKLDTDVTVHEGMDRNAGWHRDPSQLTLGSPYRRDALLQAGQLLITPRIGLPVRIDRWALDVSEGPRVAHVHIHEDDGENVVAEVCAGADGRVLERIEGYRIRVLRTNPSLPSVEALVKAPAREAPTKIATAPETGSGSPLHAARDDERGDRGETIFRFRFPLSFASVGLPSGTAHVAEIAHWLGQTREIGIRPSGVYAAASRHVATGRYAWVTKETEIRVVGDVHATDSIEVECWNERQYGPESASLEMLYRWYRITANGERLPVAESAQTTTWAETIGHGQVRPAPYPSDMAPWLTGTLPKRDAGTRHLEWTADSELGAVRWALPEGPNAGIELAADDFRTSASHGNMVGNVYWANYLDWMVETRDHWLGEQVPFGEGELRAVRTRVQHLREAMPGDRIRMRMKVLAEHERGLRLLFDAYRYDPKGEEIKLARLSHDAVWRTRHADGIWRPSTMRLKLPSPPRT